MTSNHSFNSEHQVFLPKEFKDLPENLITGSWMVDLQIGKHINSFFKSTNIDLKTDWQLPKFNSISKLFTKEEQSKINK